MFSALSILIFAIFSTIDINICMANPIIAPKIIIAPEKAYPFVVSIQKKQLDSRRWQIRNKFSHICGGSLITRKFVLTTAHCLDENISRNNYKVLVGSNDLKRTRDYYIRTWLSYEKWSTMNKNKPPKYPGNDIAIVELTKLISTEINLAKITTTLIDELLDRQVLTAGWGMINDGTILRYMVQANLTIISRKKCVDNIRAAHQSAQQYTLDENFFCTNGDPYAILYCGDSGNPVLLNGNVIIGINESICPIESKELLTGKEQNIHIDIRLYAEFISAVSDNCTIKRANSALSCWSF